MIGLSILTFSKDDTKKVLDLIGNVYDVADEIVVIDSSSKAHRNELVKAKRAGKLDKLHILYALPLGYVEPYRMYGISTCKYNWILYLDADERISDELRAVIRAKIARSDVDGFLINRVLYGENNALRSRYDKQLRLFKSGHVTYHGFIHEQPDFRGRIRELPESCSISHHHTSQEAERKKFITRYIPIEMLTQRITYDSFRRQLKKRKFTRPIYSFVKSRMKLSGLDGGDELTRSDYKLLALLQALAYASSIGPKKLFDSKEIRQLWRDNSMKANMFYEVPRHERAVQLRISKAIEKAGGVINFLGLANQKGITDLNNRYGSDTDNGVAILTKALRDRYKKLYGSL